MKIILSRKGFDSASGGVPSPIFPDGRMISLPIPDKTSPIRYEQISWNGDHLGSIVSQLTGGRTQASHRAHLDPDLDRLSFPRQKKWRPLLGQVKAAQGHLRNQCVQKGDVFLFYGLFRKVIQNASLIAFDPADSPKHVIWGWLQIAKIVNVDSNKTKVAWAMYHPHFGRPPDKTNTAYIAMRKICIPDLGRRVINGAGVFSRYNDTLQLTHPKSTKPSQWRLPEWFYPRKDRQPLSYHSDRGRWRRQNGYALLNTVARGQEFVLDCSEHLEAKTWLGKILNVQ